MRLSSTLTLLLLFSGIAAAQQPETNFPVGPQYLVTAPPGSILQPIATPIVSPWQQVGVVSPQTGEAEPVTVPAVVVPANLAGIYWGVTVPVAVVQEPSAPAPSGFPPDYIDLGVGALVSDAVLRQEGYGLSLAEVARYWREHKPHATHVYTNADIERLHGE